MKLDMNIAWRDATAMIAANREVLLIVAGIFFFLPGLAMTFAMPDLTSAAENPEQLFQMFAEFYTSFWWLMLISYVLQILGYLTLLTLLRDDRKPTVGEALRAGLVSLLPAIGAYLIMSFGMGMVAALIAGIGFATGAQAVIGIAIVALMVLMFYAAIKFSLTGAVIAIDKVRNPISALAQSWRLTKGNSARLFGFFLLILIVYFVASLLVGMVLSLLLLVLGAEIGLIVSGVVSGALSAIATLVFVAALAASHRQLSGDTSTNVDDVFG